MTVTFTPTRMRISIDRYQKMVAAGVLTSIDRVELIDGEIVGRAPIGTQHASVTRRLYKRLLLAAGDTAVVAAGNPIDLGDFSEPEPDLVVLKPRADDYLQGHPRAEDVLLLIEVADSSLAFDQGAKRELYAKFGVVEYWVVDVTSQRVLVYLDPVHGVFQSNRTCGRGDFLSPRALPDVAVAVSELFA